MHLALDNLQKLIYYKTQTNKKQQQQSFVLSCKTWNQLIVSKYNY